MSKESIKAKDTICKSIDRRSNEIIKIGTTIMRNPELGFREFKTAELVISFLEKLGLTCQTGLAITGVKTKISSKGTQPTVAVMGELDALICPRHPLADLVTGAAHACGHNTQIAAMLGAGVGLIDSGAVDELEGNIALMAAPAEEGIEIEFKQELKDQGKLLFFSGKQELLRIGALDDIDSLLMIHSKPHPRKSDRRVGIGGTLNGVIRKRIQFVGREAHAGAAPHYGINALNAAMIALMGIHAQRETFQEKDYVRIHPIITKGGDVVNVVPADIQMETYVRAKTIDAIKDANLKLNRAVRSGAKAVGAKTIISDSPGSLPLVQDPGLTELFRENTRYILGSRSIVEEGHLPASTDLGDISHVIPSVQPNIGGAKGRVHTPTYEIVDPEMAYIIPAKILAMTVFDLLQNGAKQIKRIMKAFKPKFGKDTYMKFWSNLLTQK